MGKEWWENNQPGNDERSHKDEKLAPPLAEVSVSGMC